VHQVHTPSPGGLAPFSTPSPFPDTRRTIVSKLHECNQADKKELDWQGQFEALLDARRLVCHHAELLRPPPALHNLLMVVAPVVEQLRSQTVRLALLLLQEMFCGLGRALDRELDEVVPALLKRAGEVRCRRGWSQGLPLAVPGRRAVSVFSRRRCLRWGGGRGWGQAGGVTPS
jgi:hypothetical protein